MTNQGFKRLKSAQRRWKKTTGEYVLRLAGMVFALSAIYIGYLYSTKITLNEEEFGKSQVLYKSAYDIKRTDSLLFRKILFLSSSYNSRYLPRVHALKESIHSYFGVEITAAPLSQYKSALLKQNDAVLVFGITSTNNISIEKKIASDSLKMNKPLIWVGSGFKNVASSYGIQFKENPVEIVINDSSNIEYNGQVVSAAGLKVYRAALKSTPEDLEVLSELVSVDQNKSPVILQNKNVTYISFIPFTDDGYTYALAITVDAISNILGRHKKNPRVIFRLEDVNARSYGKTDTSFNKTARFIEKEKLPVHVAIIPTMVDANGDVIATIGESRSVLDFIKRNPDLVTVVQHGTRHHRKDPRNYGKMSGDAFEYFLTDDYTMGAGVAYSFSFQRMMEGYNQLKKLGINPLIFEAPHYELSPSQQHAANKIFPIMHHQPIFYNNEYMNIVLPWFSVRDDTVYAPSSIGYIDAVDKKSVENILYQMKILSEILPDPVVVVFFHPFMIEHEGRETDIIRLVNGIRKLKYRFIRTKDELVIKN